jgi:2-polyprenyl-3-methyl-5-hydroxy-6-metoxy-1,4-benzoquinol methylase
MKKNSKKELLYEKFHKLTNTQSKIINKNNFTYEIILGILRKYIKGRTKILDIGCGAGTISFYLAKKGNEVMGIDISEKAIDACMKSTKKLNLNNINFKKMNFPYEIPNEKYDIVLCIETIEHLKDDSLALKRVFSLLKPNGVLILSTPSSNAPLFRMGYANQFDKRVGHLRRYSIADLIKKFHLAGFEVIETKKTEGLIRNFLFLNPIAGKLVRYIKYPFSSIINIVDYLCLKLFGESDLFIIAKKTL